MEEKYNKEWRYLPRSYQFDGTSFVISDSDDEDVVENSAHGHLLIDESHEEDPDKLENSTPIKNPSSDVTSDLLKKTVKRLFKEKIIDSDLSTNESQTESQYETFYNSANDSESEYESEDEDYEPAISYSPVESKQGKKRKDVSHDNTKEDIKELKLNSSNSELSEFRCNENKAQDSDVDSKTSDLEDEASLDVPVTVTFDSDSRSGECSESELAISLAKQEIGVGNVDPLTAQKRALIVCKLQSLKDELATKKLLFTEGNIEILPDKGEKLRESIREQEEEISKLTLELEETPLFLNFDIDEETTGVKKEPRSVKEEPISIDDMLNNDESFSDQTDESFSDQADSYFDFDHLSMKSTAFPELGKKAEETELALTVERLQDLHGSLVARPSEDERADDPMGLKVPLMPHQQQALAWILWRERQKPPGGVLADDMGLGKTLTMISLILATLLDEKSFDEKSVDENDDSDSEWSSKHHSTLRHKGGTLVVCPASLLSQWDKEVRDKCKRGILSVEVYHGNNRENVPSRLAKNDIVITTYNIVAREYKNCSTLFKIHWKRAILDEAHIVRNRKSQASQAVCGLAAVKRWALTGTPIQNKEMDLYPILKFLQCSPFDDLRVWKRWVDSKNASGHKRLATVMKTIMLRRTKQELQSQGRLESLPEKFMDEVIVKLDKQEQLVYEKILCYSRTLFAQFLAERAEKGHMIDLYGGKYNKPTFFSNPNKETQFTKAQNKLLQLHADVKTYEILVLLLRLRQICCHPALIHGMLDQEDMRQSEIIDTEGENMNPEFIRRLSNISLNGDLEEDIDIDQRTEDILTITNPVFDDHRASSKMKVLLNMVEQILDDPQTNDKIIIVSQWATLLDIIALHLCSIKGAKFAKFTGSVAIKDRPAIIEAFNDPKSNTRILLLSLTAGGIGLNLMGGNHLFLFDNHWNPQLENQAQDRIYRFGQKKNVYIYKFICSDTIEERIKALQEYKLEIARSVLSGVKSNAAMKLTLNDLRSLFGL